MEERKMTTKEAFDTTVNALRNTGLTSDEILDVFSTLFDYDVSNQLTLKQPPKDKKQALRELLLNLGISKHTRGYSYLFESILLYASTPYLPVSNVIYPQIAEKFNSTPSRVEHAIRYTITKGLDNLAPDDIKHFFGNSINFYKSKPTNAEFLALCAEYINNL